MATNEEVQENAPIVMATYVRLPPPRQLTKNESLDSLDHWKSIFKSYFRRDSIFRQFLASDCTWDSNEPNYGLPQQDDQNAYFRFSVIGCVAQ